MSWPAENENNLEIILGENGNMRNLQCFDGDFEIDAMACQRLMRDELW